MTEQTVVRYNGFTCPNCGSHMFGTHKHFAKFMGNEFPDGALIGSCHEHQQSGNGCTFKWNRSNKEVEDQCIYRQTHEEWITSFKETLPVT